MRKREKMAVSLMFTALVVGSVSAGVISVNFAENYNQGFAGGQNIGPLATDSANWNNTIIDGGTGTFNAGTLGNLKDDTGANTGAAITWSSANTWYNSDGTGDDDHKLSVGYLDDGTTTNLFGGAVSALMTIANIPYAEYRIYGLLASDDNGGDAYSSRNFQVNGNYVWGAGDRNAKADAYGNINAANAATGNNWVEIEQGVTRGNYWTYETSGSSVVVNGIDRWDGGRASITGIIIEQIPEPATLGMLAVFGGGILFIRRKLMV